MTTPRTLFKFGSGLTGENINGYSTEGAARKAAFHKDGKKFLKQLATELALTPGSYDIRSNLGGIAVSGEVTLHAEHIYVQLAETARPGAQILYRHCQGRKDYCGGQNNMVSVKSLVTAEEQTRFWQNCTRVLTGAVLSNAESRWQ
jgi:hypothetical protein